MEDLRIILLMLSVVFMATRCEYFFLFGVGITLNIIGLIMKIYI